jgi:hypothetical protein
MLVEFSQRRIIDEQGVDVDVEKSLHHIRLQHVPGAQQHLIRLVRMLHRRGQLHAGAGFFGSEYQHRSRFIGRETGGAQFRSTESVRIIGRDALKSPGMAMPGLSAAPR